MVPISLTEARPAIPDQLCYLDGCPESATVLVTVSPLHGPVRYFTCPACALELAARAMVGTTYAVVLQANATGAGAR